MAAKTVTLNPGQVRRVGKAREVASAEAASLSEGYGHVDPDNQAMVYAYAYGVAQQTVRHLLEVIDELTGG